MNQLFTLLKLEYLVMKTNRTDSRLRHFPYYLRSPPIEAIPVMSWAASGQTQRYVRVWDGQEVKVGENTNLAMEKSLREDGFFARK